jgi:hypothetical protein
MSRDPTRDPSGRARLLLQEILHPAEMDRFVAGCLPTSLEAFGTLRRRIANYLELVERASLRPGRLDLDSATAISTVLVTLLDEGDHYDASERALLRGAVDYFVDSDDGAHDLTDALGFDDDARVVNAVLDALDRRDLLLGL